jgi:hypothetical protein
MDGISLVMRRRSRASKVVDFVDVKIDRHNDVMSDDAKALKCFQMPDILAASCREIVETRYAMSLIEKDFT